MPPKIDPERLARIRHVALDMDGTIYRGGTRFDFTLPFLATLDRLGIGYTFLTNNSSKSVDNYLRHLNAMQIPATRQQLYTSTYSTIAWLRATHPTAKRLFVLGTQSMRDELASEGFEIIDSLPTDVSDPARVRPDVLVLGFDTDLVFSRLCAAAYWAARGVPYVASHPDAFCPTDLPAVLVDCGAIVAAIERATGRRPDFVAGKPEPHMLQSLMQRHGLRADQMIMAGDRLSTDVAMAARAGALGVLVLTGDSKDADVAALLADAAKPDLVLPSLAELGQMLDTAHTELAKRGAETIA